MPIMVELTRPDGTVLRHIADPSGGYFDAAGDFDRFMDTPTYPTLNTIDIYANQTLAPSSISSLLTDIQTALQQPSTGPERRGLLRLRAMAQQCQQDSELRLIFIGD